MIPARAKMAFQEVFRRLPGIKRAEGPLPEIAAGPTPGTPDARRRLVDLPIAAESTLIVQ